MNTQELFKNTVLNWISKGMPQAEIARSLGISRSALYNKLKYNERLSADLWLKFQEVQSKINETINTLKFD